MLAALEWLKLHDLKKKLWLPGDLEWRDIPEFHENLLIG
jgi:hypothetical protein